MNTKSVITTLAPAGLFIAGPLSPPGRSVASRGMVADLDGWSGSFNAKNTGRTSRCESCRSHAARWMGGVGQEGTEARRGATVSLTDPSSRMILRLTPRTDIMRPIHVLAGTASAAALVASGVLIAGPVNPPAGAIAPTYKTLGEVEPRIPVQTLPGNATATYVISQPGSYYLTGNIAAASSKDGVLIQASGVTLDLKGFTIASQGGSTGVGVRSTSDSTTIRNGVVRDFPAGGIDLSTSVAGLHRVSDLIALTNGQFNIKVGVRSHIEDCKSYGSTGFVLGNATTVDRCRAYSGNRGFEVGASCVLTDCLANGQFGIDPYGYGFYDAGFGNTYTNCVASFNRWTGFYALSRAEFINCKSISNEAYGFDIADRGVLLDCVAEGNTGAGVHASGGAKVRDCTVLGGLSHGIHVEGTGTLVEGCAVSRCADGIRVDGTLNRVVRSSCSANTTNWRIATGNYCYVIWGAATSAAFSGNNGGTAVPSSDPTANYSY